MGTGVCVGEGDVLNQHTSEQIAEVTAADRGALAETPAPRSDPTHRPRSTAAFVAARTRFMILVVDGILALLTAFTMVSFDESMLAPVPLLWFVLSALRSSRLERRSHLVSLNRLRNFHVSYTVFVLFVGLAIGSMHTMRVAGLGLFGLGLAAIAARWTIRQPAIAQILDLNVRESVMVVGARSAVERTIREFDELDEMWVMGVCLPSGDTGPPYVLDVPVIGRVRDVASVTRAYLPDVVAVHDVGKLGGRPLARLQWALESVGSQLSIITPMTNTGAHRTVVRSAGRRVMVDVAHQRPSGPTALIKDCIERVLAAGILVVTLPVLAVCGLVVKLSSPGPVLFKQIRIGEASRTFKMYKFRTMWQDAEQQLESLCDQNEVGGGLFKMRRDPRITPAGKWLRRLSFDELPQLWNVIKGDMSLIGPRPALPEEVATYDVYALRRLSVKPGLTGLWQVSGRSNLTWEESVRIDSDYVDNWRPGRDVSIALRTLKAVLRRDGAY
jgi:exopolysaccharide biosynthesis polyprenyl glycosylphosphotransferase